MRYANMRHSSMTRNNIGDNVQLMAIDYIYSQMGINDIVYINKNELSSYDGEYTILPITMPLIDYKEGGICGWFSDRIIPVFIGLTLAKGTLTDIEVDYYKRYEPIGCRDERTFETLKKYGIMVYLNGCITAALPLSSTSIEERKTIYIVDVHESLIKFIPKQILDKAEFCTHFYDEKIEDIYNFSKDVYADYNKNAAMVITSLLHCAVPCMAAGIPVILAKEQCSYRFGWLEKLLNIYTINEFSSIDWDPSPVYYEDHKKRVLDCVISRLKEVYEKYSKIYDLSYFYENRTKKPYIVDAFESIRLHMEKIKHENQEIIEYGIWGLTQVSLIVVEYMNENFPNAKLVKVFDKFRRVEFKGIKSENPENISSLKDIFVFITTTTAKNEAIAFFNEIGKNEKTYVCAEIIH